MSKSNIAAIGISIVALCLAGAQENAPLIRAKRLSIVDNEGKTRIMLGVNVDDHATIFFSEDKNGYGAMLCQVDGGFFLSMSNTKGEKSDMRVMLSVLPDGSGSLEVCDTTGKSGSLSPSGLNFRTKSK